MYPRPSVGWLLAVVLIYPLGAGAQRMSLDDAARGSISGRVLVSPDSRPAQRIEVKLALFTRGLQPTVLTDDNGEFQFAGLPPGTYIVTVEEMGYDTIQETVQVGFGSQPELTLCLRKTDAPPSGQSGALVSVRELSIPGKARKEFDKGLRCRAKNDFTGSLPHFQRAVAEFPAYYEAYLQLGLAYWQLGQTADAEKAIRKSVELSGERFADADFALSELLADEKQYGDAEKAARNGLLVKPASWVGNYLLGRVLFGLNRLKEAEESARKVLSLKRDFKVVHLLLASIHLRTRDNGALLNDLDTYLTLDPNSGMSTKVRKLREAVQQDLANAQHTLLAPTSATP